MTYDCIIIGGGLSGLAAGIRLAHFGKKICILEKHSRLGGLNSHYTKNGCEIDSGLHAMTNFTAKSGPKSAPLAKLLRQLRIGHDELELREQNHSLVVFPGVSLKFTNDFEFLKTEIQNKFPQEIDGFVGLDKYLTEFDSLSLSSKFISARKVVSEYIKNPMLADMLFCPLMYYGSAVENDMDFAQFAIMYQSIFKEGFCRPAGGIAKLLGILEKRITESGGEIRKNCEVRRIISENGIAKTVVLRNGETISAKNILSSAGHVETLSLCEEKPANFAEIPRGQMAFVETVGILDSPLHGYESTIIFFNSSEKFHYQNPAGIIDSRSGVICSPNNFRFLPSDTLPAPMIRITVLANPQLWNKYPPDEYRTLKNECSEKTLSIASEYAGVPDLREKVKLIDTFTPKTITRYTGHINGAVYGCPEKVKDGRTHLGNVFLCGTDQGFLGITGSMLSGISIANLHLLK
ncbi:MAG: FAD-dependent oxidoreductase [Lentisphaerae bacterium]|nr:FAD-dependent oxidoreductase [Lentisphaerota bacterium]